MMQLWPQQLSYCNVCWWFLLCCWSLLFTGSLQAAILTSQCQGLSQVPFTELGAHLGVWPLYSYCFYFSYPTSLLCMALSSKAKLKYVSSQMCVLYRCVMYPSPWCKLTFVSFLWKMKWEGLTAVTIYASKM